MNQEQLWLRQVPVNLGWYLAGFSDGEGSFNVSLKKTPEYQCGWKLEPSFNVSQRDITALALMKRALGCGTLRNRKDGVVYYEVRNYRALQERVIPFFDKFSFYSASKKKNFSIFRRIVRLMVDGGHLNPDGMREILRLREKLNEGRGRKRKYNIGDYENSRKKSSTTIRQTPI